MNILPDDEYYVVTPKSGKKSGSLKISDLQQLVDSGKLSERSVLEMPSGVRMFAQDITQLNFSLAPKKIPKVLALDERVHMIHVWLRWTIGLGLCCYLWPLAIIGIVGTIVQIEFAKDAGLDSKSTFRLYGLILVSSLIVLVLAFFLFMMGFMISYAKSGSPKSTYFGP